MQTLKTQFIILHLTTQKTVHAKTHLWCIVALLPFNLNMPLLSDLSRSNATLFIIGTPKHRTGEAFTGV